MDAANLAQQQRIERNLEEFNRYNKYLEEYYNDESLRKMSSSVRDVVQEWMNMNKYVQSWSGISQVYFQFIFKGCH